MQNKPRKGIVAAGHSETAEAARLILAEGGNAFDAVLAGLLAACVAEPVLASLGGGGFLMAKPSGHAPCLYDFFVHTPKRRADPAEVEFYGITADFGPVQQEFHIGAGAIATPGVVKGLFGVHRDLGAMPLAEIAAPALALARDGVVTNAFQADIFRIVAPVYLSGEATKCLFGRPDGEQGLAGEGDRLRNPEFADALDSLVHEGEDLFYRGEIGARLANHCHDSGGLLSRDDLRDYRLERRAPLRVRYRDGEIHTNPPPSSGGVLIAFALDLLHDSRLYEDGLGSTSHLQTLIRVMDLTQEARLAAAARGRPLAGVREPESVDLYRRKLAGRTRNNRGTTQISVADGLGNFASLTVSNGEGSGYLIPQTGISMNNMLGEADLHPQGFHRWNPDERIVSMMSPTLVSYPDGAVVATGSGGSNRIRTALLQVLSNLLDFRVELEQAVVLPRVHYEDGFLNVEAGFHPERVQRLLEGYPRHKLWPDTHLFFGGAHSVARLADGRFVGQGDPRRGGVHLTA